MAAPPNSINDNFLLLTDSYKITHHKQYPPGISVVYSYFECRGGQFKDIVFYGLQYIIKRYLVGPVVNHAMIDEARAIFDAHLGPGLFNYEGWKYIVDTHGGFLPLRIKAVPEGTIVPVKNVLFTVENTDPKCCWLTNYVETMLVQVWYPLTVATISREMKKTIASYLDETADNLQGLPFKLHDFGCRGVSSMESAGLGGSAHLVNFVGTDTVPALTFAKKFYNASMPGFSIPASEHSTITAWGQEGELAAFRNMLIQFPKGLVACVSDSYDLYNAVEKFWGEELKDLILSRDGVLVIRPDSGDPPTVVVEVLNILGRKFGTTTNSKGYKMLPPQLRMIQGDGIAYDTLGSILEKMKENKWSADNLAFGCGGGLLQKLNRDTQKCALKCSFAVVNGKGVNVFKDPITDSGKTSKKGRLTLEREDTGVLSTVQEGCGNKAKDILVTVFENGILVKEYNFDEVRKLARIDLEIEQP